MTVLSSAECYGILLLAGMPKGARCTEFVAIAECESSLNTDAISPVGALGLWQIMPFNFGPLGLAVSDWRNPDTNARAAVLLSGHGANCAAWDTCYFNIQSSGRYSFLNWPEHGSCASNNLGRVSVVVGTHNQGGAMAPPEPGAAAQLIPALNGLARLTEVRLPALIGSIDIVDSKVNHLTRGVGG